MRGRSGGVEVRGFGLGFAGFVVVEISGRFGCVGLLQQSVFC